MKSVFATLCWMMLMLVSLPACSDDNGEIIDPYTKEQKKWIADNQSYFQDRKESVGDNGQLLYKQLVVSKDTLLYRILGEAGKVDSFPDEKSDIKVSIKGVLPVNNTVFVGDSNGKPVERTIHPDDPSQIKGLSAVLLKVRKGEMVETIIPYQLGCGDTDSFVQYSPIPLCSTLLFTFTVVDFN